ncbi:FecR protein [Pedobacter steynii]|uniref:FecR protein n=1 Tax=Pedobacter steynii TaxID=430522 RepID=A0A1G9S7E5_9SPHI|nr:FecR family protein [Pedobacter steynii]NQX37520.1 FecR domain-containing protein [Pedobacter steynii]SDM31433.1 FecR protein [Pedobacter steynii]
MKEQVKYLLGKFEKGTLSAAESLQLLELTGTEEETVVEGISEMMSEQQEPSPNMTGDLIWSGMLTKIVGIDQPLVIKRKPFLARFRWLAAAVLLLTLSVGLYFYRQVVPEPISAFPEQVTADIAPGGNKAILILADGSEISLTDAENGALARQAGITIRKTAEGQVIYDTSSSDGSENEASDGQPKYNTIATPRGGQYQINLPDGTKVWLNAASALTFPQSFNKLKQRHVILNGEAYFEVAKNKEQPFKVSTGADIAGKAQVIEVLGTHFNVNSYDDEESTKTTLLEGSLRVMPGTGSFLLRPGQQSILSQHKIKVVPADTEECLAWKAGYLQFNRADIKTVMRQIARWYDVTVRYEGAVPALEFGGAIQKDLTLVQALKILNKSQIHFRIEGREVIVMP